MGAHSRRKGARAELEWANLHGGKRRKVGYATYDVDTPPITAFGLQRWEVKRLETLPALLRDWIQQATEQGAQGIAFRADGGDWWVLTPGKEWEG